MWLILSGWRRVLVMRRCLIRIFLIVCFFVLSCFGLWIVLLCGCVEWVGRL